MPAPTPQRYKRGDPKGVKSRGLTDDDRAVVWYLLRALPKHQRWSIRKVAELVGRSTAATRLYVNDDARKQASEEAYRQRLADGTLEEHVRRLQRAADPFAPADAVPKVDAVELTELPQIGKTIDEALDEAVQKVRRGVTPQTALVASGVLAAQARAWLDSPDKGEGHQRLQQAQADHIARLEVDVARGGPDARVKLEILERLEPDIWRPVAEVEFSDRSALASVSSDRVRQELARLRGEAGDQ